MKCEKLEKFLSKEELIEYKFIKIKFTERYRIFENKDCTFKNLRGFKNEKKAKLYRKFDIKKILSILSFFDILE